MPSGAKKRKAAKKKKGAHNNNKNNTGSIGDTNNPQGNDDSRSQDERDSDGGEASSPVSQDHQPPFSEEPGRTGNEEGRKEVAVEDNTAIKIERDFSEKDAESKIHVESAKEAHGGDNRSSSSSGSSSSDDESHSHQKKWNEEAANPKSTTSFHSSEEKAAATYSDDAPQSFEKEKPLVEPNGNTVVEAIPPVDTSTPGNTVEAIHPVDTSTPGNTVEAIPPVDTSTPGNAVEAIPPVDTSTRGNTVEAIPPVESSTPGNTVEAIPPVDISTPAVTLSEVGECVAESSEVPGAEVLEVVELGVQLNDGKFFPKTDEVTAVSADAVAQEKNVGKIYPTLEDNDGQSSKSGTSPTKNRSDSKTLASSDLAAESSVNDSGTSNGVPGENKDEELPKSDVYTTRSSDVAPKAKDSEPHESTTEDQPLIPPAPRVAQRTSWMSCCGIFEVFTRSGR